MGVYNRREVWLTSPGIAPDTRAGWWPGKHEREPVGRWPGTAGPGELADAVGCDSATGGFPHSPARERARPGRELGPRRHGRADPVGRGGPVPWRAWRHRPDAARAGRRALGVGPAGAGARRLAVPVGQGSR